MALGLKTLGFRAFLATQFLGAFNDNVYRFLVIFFVLARVPEAEQGGWLNLNQVLFALPFVVLAALAGSVGDRFAKSGVIRASKGAEVAVMVAGVLAFAWGAGPAPVSVVLCLMATQSTFFGPGKYGYLAEEVGEPQLVRANALVQLTTMVAIVGGQLVAGLLYDTYEQQLAWAALWCVGFAALGTATSLAVPGVRASRPERTLVINPVPELLATWRGVRANRTLLFAMLGNGHYFLLLAAMQINLPDYGLTELGLTSRTAAGALVATATLALAVGSLLASRWSEGRVELGLVPLGALAMTGGLGLLAIMPPLPVPGMTAGDGDGLWAFVVDRLLTDGLWAPFAAAAMVGVAGGLYLVPLMALLQQHSPPDEKGRYLAFGNMVGFLGIALSGLVLQVPRELGLGFREQFLVLSGLALLGTVVSLRLLPYAFVRLLVWLLAHSIYRIRVLHGERLPATGGALLMANHVSWVDALVLGASTRRKLHFLMYRPYFEWWPTRWLFELAGCIPVAGGDDPEETRASLAHAGELLDQGRVVVIFGEGAVTRLGHMLPFRTGYQRLIEGRDACLVPVYLGGLWGSVLSHRGGRFLRKLPSLRPRRVAVAYGEPLPGHSGPARIRAAMQRLAAETWAEHPGAAPLHRVCADRARWRWGATLRDDRGRRLAPAVLVLRARALAPRLRDPASAGGRVALRARPSVDTATAVLALLFAGRVPVMIDPGLSDDEAGARARAAGAAEVRDAESLVAAAGRLSWLPLRLATAALFPVRRRGDPDGAVGVVFDPDGRPRVLTHRQVHATVEGLRHVFELDGQGDVLLGLTSPDTAFGWATNLWLPLLVDLGACWHGDPEDDRGLGRFAARSRSSLLFTDERRAARLAARLRGHALGGLRAAVVVGDDGGQADEAALLAFRERFGLRPSRGWAPPGCGGLVSLNTRDVREPGVFQRGTRPGTVGHPLPGVGVEVLDEQGALVPRPGVTGRLVVVGPCVGGRLDTERQGSVDGDGFVSLASPSG